MTALHAWSTRTTLAGALADAGARLGDVPVALVSAVAWWRFARASPSGLALRDGTRVQGDPSVFEARAFAAAGELRWLRDPDRVDGSGRAVLISEDTDGPADWDPLEPLERLERRRATLLVWGASTGAAAGWSALAEARIGHLDVPLHVPVGHRALLERLDYLGQADEHGNVRVIESRLAGLTTMAPGEAQHG